jgi:hypothetical protein
VTAAQGAAGAHAHAGAAPEQRVTLTPGERVVVVGCAHAACSRGAAWVHGHRLDAGGAGALLRSLPDVGSTVVLEGGPRGAEVALRPLAAVPVPAAAAAAGAAPCVRVLPYADAVAAGHATLLTQVRTRAARAACACPRRRWRSADIQPPVG